MINQHRLSDAKKEDKKPPGIRTLYGKDLKEYDNLPLEDLLNELTEAELEELSNEVDPDDSHIPPSMRCRDQTKKAPTGPLNRKKLLEFLKKFAMEQEDWPENKTHEPGTKRGQYTSHHPFFLSLWFGLICSKEMLANYDDFSYFSSKARLVFFIESYSFHVSSFPTRYRFAFGRIFFQHWPRRKPQDSNAVWRFKTQTLVQLPVLSFFRLPHWQSQHARNLFPVVSSSLFIIDCFTRLSPRVRLINDFLFFISFFRLTGMPSSLFYWWLWTSLSYSLFACCSFILNRLKHLPMLSTRNGGHCF